MKYVVEAEGVSVVVGTPEAVVNVLRLHPRTVYQVKPLDLLRGGWYDRQNTTTDPEDLMPFRYTCNDHDDFEAGSLEEVIVHAGAAHPGTDASVLLERGTMGRSFMSQVRAQGGEPVRIFGCRTCGVRVETTDPDRLPYCDNDLERP